ncbi:hypothetical protein [Actinomadura sp. 3N508]|uniref:hypothetical protein n=1 Tax=Actinomadura sp. 3N508 TaxID=3375153 RepID=UPI0037A6E051
MEDEFAGKSREYYLARTTLVWEMLRELFSLLPIVVGLPDLRADDSESVGEAVDAVHHAREELLPLQGIPAITESLIAEGALEMLHALLMVTHTEQFELTDWHAELWFRCLKRVEFMCGRAITSIHLLEKQSEILRTDEEEPPENQE